MSRVLSAELAGHAGRSVTIAGWVHRRRLLKSVAFLILRDRAGLAQVVVTDPARLAAFPEETVVRVTGAARANPAAPGGVQSAPPRQEPEAAPDPTDEQPEGRAGRVRLETPL